MKLPRRTFLKFAGAAVAAPAFSKVATAGSYPSRPITIVVPVPAGGPTDAIARVLAQPMRGSLGQPILIENVSGGDGNIGTGRVARATPDGYTIELGASSTHVFPGALYSLPYDVSNDFAPVAPLATTVPVLFSRKTMPTKDLNELIAWLKANPNKASAGIVSTTGRLLTAFFQKETSTQFTLVPYNRAVAVLRASGHRAQFHLPVQAQGRRYPGGRARAGRTLRAGRKRSADRR